MHRFVGEGCRLGHYKGVRERERLLVLQVGCGKRAQTYLFINTILV